MNRSLVFLEVTTSCSFPPGWSRSRRSSIQTSRRRSRVEANLRETTSSSQTRSLMRQRWILPMWRKCNFTKTRALLWGRMHWRMRRRHVNGWQRWKSLFSCWRNNKTTFSPFSTGLPNNNGITKSVLDRIAKWYCYQLTIKFDNPYWTGSINDTVTTYVITSRPLSAPGVLTKL